MGWDKIWNKNQCKTHDDNLNGAMKELREVIVHARALHANYVKIRSHTWKLVEAVHGQRRGPLLEAASSLHGIMNDVHLLARELSSPQARNHKMTDAEIKRHHADAQAAIALVRENAGHAAALAENWKRMADNLETIMKLYG